MMARRLAWDAGRPIRVALVGLIGLYQRALSPVLGGRCRFYPSCSAYAIEAIQLRGAIRGGSLALWHILRCNPFGRGGVERVAGGPLYEDVVPTTDGAAV
jgi:putative membrane protein insertion efficiency factor